MVKWKEFITLINDYKKLHPLEMSNFVLEQENWSNKYKIIYTLNNSEYERLDIWEIYTMFCIIDTEEMYDYNNKWFFYFKRKEEKGESNMFLSASTTIENDNNNLINDVLSLLSSIGNK